MSSQFENMSGADVVSLSRIRSNSVSRNRISSDTSRTKITVPAQMRDSATLLSIRQTLRYQASVGLDNIDAVYTSSSKFSTSSIMASVRLLLEKEFGHLRVHRYRQVFMVGHHCQETLVSGLLRVQFHARELHVTPEQNTGPEVYNPQIVWGVGGSMHEAETQRQLRCQPVRP